MPLSKYFGGHGKEVMSSMMKKHGGKKGKSIFYATANKRGMGGPPVSKEHKGKSKKSTMFSKGQ